MHLILWGKKYKPMLSFKGMDSSHLLGHTFDLGSLDTSTTRDNDFDKLRTFSHDLVDK